MREAIREQLNTNKIPPHRAKWLLVGILIASFAMLYAINNPSCTEHPQSYSCPPTAEQIAENKRFIEYFRALREEKGAENEK